MIHFVDISADWLQFEREHFGTRVNAGKTDGTFWPPCLIGGALRCLLREDHLVKRPWVRLHNLKNRMGV